MGINYMHVGLEAYTQGDVEKTGSKTMILPKSIRYTSISKEWNGRGVHFRGVKRDSERYMAHFTLLERHWNPFLRCLECSHQVLLWSGGFPEKFAPGGFGVHPC